MLDEIKTGDKPSGVALSKDGRRGVVTHWYGYDIGVLEIKDDKIALAGRVEVGPEPRGVAITADGSTAYVAVGVSNEVARVDLNARKVTGRLPVGREPRGIALSPDESRLLVGNARSQNVSLIDVKSVDGQEHDSDRRRQPAAGGRERRRQDRLYRQHAAIAGFATTRNNIDLGWVLGQRLTRVPLDGSVSYATLSLDTQGKAVSDAHGVAVSRDEQVRRGQLRRHA